MDTALGCGVAVSLSLGDQSFCSTTNMVRAEPLPQPLTNTVSTSWGGPWPSRHHEADGFIFMRPWLREFG